jgi:hypothetical protein
MKRLLMATASDGAIQGRLPTTASKRSAPIGRADTSLAASIANDRHAVSDDNTFKAQEIASFNAVRDPVEQARRLRDAALERLFQAIYGDASVVADGARAKLGSTPTAHCQDCGPVTRSL